MKYKRLTKRNCAGYVVPVKPIMSGYSNIQAVEEEVLDRLAEFEDKIEAGTFVELPCKIGDVMYEVIEGMPIQEWKIENICFNRTYPKGVIWAERTRDLAHWKFWIEDCGTKWFVTKAEAEKKLEKRLKEKSMRVAKYEDGVEILQTSNKLIDELLKEYEE